MLPERLLELRHKHAPASGYSGQGDSDLTPRLNGFSTLESFGSAGDIVTVCGPLEPRAGSGLVPRETNSCRV
jgi:hypothetical protein